MTTTTHKLSLSRWALCVSTDTWATWSPPGPKPLGEERTGGRDRLGRPDSRARRAARGSVQHGSGLLKSHTCTHLGIMPLSQFIRTVGEIQLARSGDNTFFKGGPFLVVG